MSCETCIHCGEAFAPGDRRFPIMSLGQDGARRRYAHRECSLRQVVGSVGHQFGRCSCHGGKEEDPEGLTKRDAARAAVRLYEQLQQKPGIA